tara:strand:+ start:676 stop:1008 length:333 start_codon:yes stop_codon:yes gene_type:complete
MKSEKYKQIVKPELNEQTLFQLVQLKSFVDTGIYQSITNDFENDKAKIKYLSEILFNIRDFVLTATNSNTLRINMLKAFEAVDNEEKKESVPGNEQEKLKNPEGQLVQNQ